MLIDVEWGEIQNAIWGCQVCEGSDRVETLIRQQTPSPTIKTKLLVVGIAPPWAKGVNAKIAAKSAITDPEDLLRGFLEETLEISWDDLCCRGLVFLHAVKCAIRPNDHGFQNPQTGVVNECASRHFVREFKAVKAPIVVALGQAPLRAILKSPGFEPVDELKLSPLSQYVTQDCQGIRVRVEGCRFQLYVSWFPRGENKKEAARIVRKAAKAARLL